MDKVFTIDDSKPSRLPEAVTKLWQSNQEKIEKPPDYFALILHALMTEAGFVNSENGAKDIFKTSDMEASVYRFCYSLQRDPERRECCSLSIILVGSVSAIVGTFHGENGSESFRIPRTRLSDYVSVRQNLPSCFTGLRELSRNFKSNLALPMLFRASEALNLPSGNESILCLPVEILLQIIKQIGCVKTLSRLEQTCSTFYNLIKDERPMWKELYNRDFPEQHDQMMKLRVDLSDFGWRYKYHNTMRQKKKSSASASAGNSSNGIRVAVLRDYLHLL